MTKWESWAAEIEELVSGDRVHRFLRDRVVRHTMFGGFKQEQLDYLRALPERWEQATKVSCVGNPSNIHDGATGCSVRQAYYLARMEAFSGIDTRDYATIVEYGGGYGEMCRVVRALGFEGRYVIYDLPPVIRLQQYYLGELGIEAEYHTHTLPAPEGRPSLFVAAWSLGETSLKERERHLDTMAEYDAYLFGYQNEWNGIDNNAFFAELQSAYTHVMWENVKKGRGHQFLFGVRA